MHSVRVAHLIREMARNHYRSAAARAFLLPGEKIKGAMVSHKTTMEATRQGQRYPHFGVPVWTVYGMAGADAVLERLGRGRLSGRIH